MPICVTDNQAVSLTHSVSVFASIKSHPNHMTISNTQGTNSGKGKKALILSQKCAMARRDAGATTVRTSSKTQSFLFSSFLLTIPDTNPKTNRHRRNRARENLFHSVYPIVMTIPKGDDLGAHSEWTGKIQGAFVRVCVSGLAQGTTSKMSAPQGLSRHWHECLYLSTT